MPLYAHLAVAIDQRCYLGICHYFLPMPARWCEDIAVFAVCVYHFSW